MARDRQRAKRRQRRAAGNPAAQNPKPEGTEQNLHRENVPGELEHASGQVEQFEAALVAGAEGVPEEQPDQAGREGEEAYAPEPGFDEGVDEEPADVETVGAPQMATLSEKRSGNSIVNFLRASWAELQRVQWPDRRQVGQATAVVLGFVVIAGAYLGLADALAQEIVNFII